MMTVEADALMSHSSIEAIQLAILRDLIGQIFATELDFIGKCLGELPTVLALPPCQTSVMTTVRPVGQCDRSI
jgi:hypothetical protein